MEVNPNSPQSNGSSVSSKCIRKCTTPRCSIYVKYVLRKNWNLTRCRIRTQYSIKTLTALEQDDYKSLPEATFIKGYYRTYAKYLKVDATNIIQRFDDIYANDTGLLPNHALNNSPIKIMGKLPGSNRDRNRKWLKRGLIALAVLVVIGLIVAAVQGMSSDSSNEDAVARDASSGSPEHLNLDRGSAVCQAIS